MKIGLIKHIQMVFKALNIESTFNVFDCEIDNLPEWAIGLSHPFKYLVTSSALEKKDKLSFFLSKEIQIYGNMIYWYEGECISLNKQSESLEKKSEPINTSNLCDVRFLKTKTRLPIWLDNYIFNDLKAQYSPNHERFDFNLDLSESDILKYLGTYFPRSYGESFCIFDNLFQNKLYNAIFNAHDNVINIVVVGCGTGGDLLGLLTIITKYIMPTAYISHVPMTELWKC